MTLDEIMQAARFARQVGEYERVEGLAREALQIGGNRVDDPTMDEARELLAWATKARPAHGVVLQPETSGSRNVTIVDVRIPFWSMVVLLIKVCMAAIPAAIILLLFWFAVGAGLGGIFSF